jgi:hypothetical protein
LCDHEGGVCRHEAPHVTVASVLMDLTAGTFEIVAGPPCGAPATTWTLGT